MGFRNNLRVNQGPGNKNSSIIALQSAEEEEMFL